MLDLMKLSSTTANTEQKRSATGVSRQLVIFSCAALLLMWLLACAGGLNHPPGVRWVRLTAACVVLAIGVLEYRRPWWGFCAFLMLWPQCVLIREQLCGFSELWRALPDFQCGPLAAALTLAYCARTSETRADMIPQPVSGWTRALKAALWILSASWLLSTVLFYMRMLGSLPGWDINYQPLRFLLAPTAVSSLLPLRSLLNFLAPLLLGVVLLNDLAGGAGVPAGGRIEIRRESIYKWLVASGSIVAIEAILQMWCGWKPAFDVNPPGAPFGDRNVLAPVLVLTAAALFLWAQTMQSLTRKALAVLPGIVMLVTALLSGSRNGQLMVFAALWLPLLIGGNWRRVAIGLAVVLAFVAAAFYAPLPDPQAIRSDGPRRAIQSVVNLRAASWNELTTYRTEIYEAALEVWWSNPALGSGPGTFVMLTSPTAKYNDFYKAHGYRPMHCHSVPLNLLAELGPLAALAWLVLWVVFPLAILWRGGPASGPALLALLIGAGNLVDAVWLQPSIATLSVLLLMVAAGTAKTGRRGDGVTGRNGTTGEHHSESCGAKVG
ncbi:MAG TPA: O-antigen ligase family protein [Planctomycetota bacterium]|jgi:O-antigen ligase